MNLSKDWSGITRRMEQLLRLRSFPVAFKLFEETCRLEEIPYLRRMKNRVTLCRMINMARNFNWTVGAEAEDFLTPMCPSIIGMAHLPDYYWNGTFRSTVWVKTKEQERLYENSIPRIPPVRYKAVAMGPLVHSRFHPDMVLIYSNPAQMIILISVLQFEDYRVTEFFCVGESSCADTLARCHLEQRPFLSIPCYGERRYGHAQDDELAIALPSSDVERALRGLEGLYKRGIRYPISYAGAELDVTSAFPDAHGSARKLEEIWGRGDNRVLLGVTGGIASGKSTVAKMLEELGAPIIDFDQLSRLVVEPGRPAWREIVQYFGEHVLNEDRTLDRKKLSEIIFRDMEKRKRLESFIHPRVTEEFSRLVNEYAGKDPNVIIQAVIPLLIETNMQHLFHKILLVYVPEEVQIQRLMERDKISREMALNMLKAQLPIEEKRAYADYIIDNSGSLEDTKRQVLEVWEKIKDFQTKRSKGIEPQ